MAEPIKFKKLPNGDIIKGFELESVGTFISLGGWTFAMYDDGSIDTYSATHFDEIEPDGDWMTALSDNDRKIVEGSRLLYTTLMEAIMEDSLKEDR